MSNRKYIFKWLIFHCHVSFRGCTSIFFGALKCWFQDIGSFPRRNPPWVWIFHLHRSSPAKRPCCGASDFIDAASNPRRSNMENPPCGLGGDTSWKDGCLTVMLVFRSVLPGQKTYLQRNYITTQLFQCPHQKNSWFPVTEIDSCCHFRASALMKVWPKQKNRIEVAINYDDRI